MSETSAAYRALVEIAQRSRANARGLPEQEEATVQWSGVGFTLDSRKYVVPMGEVSEILEMPRFTQVPGVKGWVKGVANVRGRLMPIMDLMMFLNRQSGLQSKRRRLLVLERGELYSGLIVDEVLGMQHFSVDWYTDEIPTRYRDTQIYLKGGYQQDSEFWAVFSLFTLARDPRFLDVAS
ncbi:Twitching motility protein, CheW analog, possibly involved in chemotaxis [gamma proteobacterium HdN1]|nr:Twitching motility protein, CheW analog, possibly involved in chemotaxis [gamma proteobacterium HdN1]